MENRSGLIVRTAVTQATGTAEREAAKAMVQQLPRTTRRITIGGDKGYDTRDFVSELRKLKITPHMAQNTSNRRSAIDGRTNQPSKLRDQPENLEANRRRLRLDENGWQASQDDLPRSGEDRHATCPTCSGLQSGTDEEFGPWCHLKSGKRLSSGCMMPNSQLKRACNS